jgi:hypothetical protein
MHFSGGNNTDHVASMLLPPVDMIHVACKCISNSVWPPCGPGAVWTTSPARNPRLIVADSGPCTDVAGILISQSLTEERRRTECLPKQEGKGKERRKGVFLLRARAWQPHAARAARVSRDGLAVSRSHWAAWAFECPMIDLLISTWSAPGVRASRLVCHFRRVVGRSSQFSSLMCISRLTIWLN